MAGISIIFPVFNTERYVKESSDSILQQKNVLLEVICIDDCSTDQSFRIVSEIAMKDNRVKVIHNKHRMGYSYSLNIALPQCQYELIAYVDSDDLLVSSSFFEEAINMYSKDDDAELLIARVLTWHNEKLLPFKIFKDNPTQLTVNTLLHEEWSKQKYDDVKIFLMQATIHKQLWGKTYKKSFLHRIKLYFPEYSEYPYPGVDDIWFYYMVIEAKSIILLEQYVYFYNFHDTSLSYDKRLNAISAIRDDRVNKVITEFYLPKFDLLHAAGLLDKYYTYNTDIVYIM